MIRGMFGYLVKKPDTAGRGLTLKKARIVGSPSSLRFERKSRGV